MKIVSKFRDYYDGLMSHESQLVWRRERIEYHADDYNVNPDACPVGFPSKNAWPHTDYKRFENWKPKVSYETSMSVCKGLLGFCGKVYKVLSVRGEIFCTTYDMLDFALLHYKERTIGRGDTDIHKWLEEDYFDSDWNHYYKKTEDAYRYPVWLTIGRRMIINPNLGEIGFSRIKKNFEAFQELEMWLGNYAPPDLVPALSNEDNIERLGHDLKQSFRHRK